MNPSVCSIEKILPPAVKVLGFDGLQASPVVPDKHERMVASILHLGSRVWVYSEGGKDVGTSVEVGKV